MRRNDLVGADISDADRFCYEADHIDRAGKDADDATKRAGRNVAVPLEQANGFVQIDSDACGRGEHCAYLTPEYSNRYGCLLA